MFQLPLWQRALTWIFGILLLALALTALVYFLGRVLVLTARGPVITARARAHLLGLLRAPPLRQGGRFLARPLRPPVLAARGRPRRRPTRTCTRRCRRSGGWPPSRRSAGSPRSSRSSGAAPGRSWPASSCWPPAWIGGLWVFPTLVQRLRVAPNALVAESPYIAHHIRLTRRAYAPRPHRGARLPGPGDPDAGRPAHERADAQEHPPVGPRAAPRSPSPSSRRSGPTTSSSTSTTTATSSTGSTGR